MPILLAAVAANLPTPFWDAAAVEAEANGQEIIGIDVEEVTNEWDRCSLDGDDVPGIVDVQVAPRLKHDAKKAHGRDGGPTFLLGLEPVKVEIVVRIWHPKQWREFLALVAKVWRKANKSSPKAVAPPPKKKVAPKIEDDGGVASVSAGASAAEAAGISGATAGPAAAAAAGAAAAAAETAVAKDVPKPKAVAAPAKVDAVREAAVTIRSPATAMFGIYAIVITGIDSPRATSNPGERSIKISAIEYIAPKSTGATATAKVTGPRATGLNAKIGDPSKNSVGPPPSKTDAVPTLGTPTAANASTTR